MAADIGAMLFEDILRMTNYATLSSGDIAQDIVMLFFIPTIIIIVFIYLLVNRMKIFENKKIQLLIGIAVYLFIVFSGYYGVIASLSGPYMVGLIFVFGLIIFVLGHFRGNKGGGGPARGPTGLHAGAGTSDEKAVEDLPEKIRNILGVPVISPHERMILEKELDSLNDRIKKLEKNVERGGSDRAVIHLDELYAQRDAIETKLEGMFGKSRRH